jgi:menaquinone-dependent protoporphyrinogen oxidase
MPAMSRAMTKVLVVYGSRHGGTRGIAERVGDVLRIEGADAVVAAADRVAPDDVRTADAFVVGSGVYMGSWLSQPLEFLRREQLLASRPTWLFSSGPLPGSSKEQPETDPLTNALGPVDGPGSGGRKKVEEVSATIHPRDHHVFNGAFDPKDPPRSMSERFVRLMPAARKVLPAGDFRDWDAIESWAREISAALPSEVPSG